MRLPSLRRMQATTAKADPTTSADSTTISTDMGVQVLDSATTTTTTTAAGLSTADITGTVECIIHQYYCLLECVYTDYYLLLC